MTTMTRAALVALSCAALAVGVGWLAGGPPVLGVPALAACAALSMLIQWVAFIPAYLRRTESFYDLTGTFTALVLVAVPLAAGAAERPYSIRPMMATTLVAIWALRLGMFLAERIRRAGKDGRFDVIKHDPGRFLIAWSLQGLWVFFTTLAALILIGEPTYARRLFVSDGVGWAMWGLGFGIEVVADRQKRAFHEDPANQGRWIDVGLWSRSRHPNYFGEILLWTGIFVSGLGVYRGAQWVAALSPLFVAALLTRGSGVPLLEARADAKWGQDPAYIAYKARTPTLIPRLWR